MVTGQAATGRRFDTAELARLARKLSVEDAVMSLSKLAWLVEEDVVAADRELITWLRPGDRERLARGPAGRALLFPARIGAAMRVALLHAERRPAQDLDEAGLRALAMLILGVVDADFAEHPRERSGGDPHAFMRRTELQQLAGRTRPPPGSQIARMHRLFVDLPQALGDPLGIAATFESAAGMSLDRYLAIAFAIVSRWMSWDRRPATWPLDHSYFARTQVGVADLEKVLAAITATPDELRASFEREAGGGRDGLWDLAAFARHPLCRMSDDRIVPVDPAMLLERLIGDGVYWRLKHLFDALGRGSEFGAELGRVLEAHLLQVAAQTLGADPAVSVFGEVPYATRQGAALGPDLAIWQNGQLVMVEVGVTRCHYGRVILGGDVEAFRDDLQRIFIRPGSGRVRQLDAKIRALREGALAYNGVPADAPVRPVVCLLDGFPTGPSLRQDLDAAISDAGLLQTSLTGPCSVMSAGDFESLCELGSHGHPVADLLDGWNATHQARPFMSWIPQWRGDDELRPKLLAEHLERTFDGWTRTLGLEECRASVFLWGGFNWSSQHPRFFLKPRVARRRRLHPFPRQ
jgi:hypothetical protein